MTIIHIVLNKPVKCVWEYVGFRFQVIVFTKYITRIASQDTRDDFNCSACTAGALLQYRHRT